MTPEQLMAIAPVPAARAIVFAGSLTAAMAAFGIDAPRRQAAFVAQVLHESANLKQMVENLNYSAASLLATFPKRITRDQAYQFGRTDEHPANQIEIANIIYAFRNGNGLPASGDGWKYRGRGPVQLTGRTNYALCGVGIKRDLINVPELLERPEEGCMAAAWYWAAGNPTGRSLNALADSGDVTGITRAINGGTLGLAERTALTHRALQVLG